MSQSIDRPQPQRYKAFTTIELLVVIAILLVLAGIVFVTIGHVQGSSKENSTRITLGNLQGMFADFENASKLSKGPVDWLWTQNGTAISNAQTLRGSAYNGFDFWRGPSNNTTTTWSQDYALASPGSVADDGIGLAGNQRHAAIAVTNTGLAMTMLAQFTDNRTRLSGIPQPQQFIPAWRSGQISLPNANQDITFVPNARVTHLGKQWMAAPGFPPGGNPPPGSAGWTDITGRQQVAPILLDAWNNPIIFVPATGLRVRLQNDPTREYIIMSPEGEANNAASPPTIIRPGRPFFASAGADGSFDRVPGADGQLRTADDKAAGDDNLYSFEK